MGSISRHITPLVINSLGGRHTHANTHTHTHTHMHTDNLYRINFKKPGTRWPRAGAYLIYKVHFLNPYILCRYISCYVHDDQTCNFLRAKSCDLQIFVLTINSHYLVNISYCILYCNMTCNYKMFWSLTNRNTLILQHEMVIILKCCS